MPAIAEGLRLPGQQLRRACAGAGADPLNSPIWPVTVLPGAERNDAAVLLSGNPELLSVSSLAHCAGGSCLVVSPHRHSGCWNPCLAALAVE